MENDWETLMKPHQQNNPKVGEICYLTFQIRLLKNLKNITMELMVWPDYLIPFHITNLFNDDALIKLSSPLLIAPFIWNLLRKTLHNLCCILFHLMFVCLFHYQLSQQISLILYFYYWYFLEYFPSQCHIVHSFKLSQI